LVTLGAAERLGHVMSMNAFSTYIADPVIRRSATGPPVFGALGLSPVRPLSDAVLRAVLLALRADDFLHAMDGVIWCFRGEPASDEPLNCDVRLLPCRLGLKRTKASGADQRWLALPIDPAPVGWHRPTFADAAWDFLADWQPGGFTAPSPGYDCGAGLPEVVGRGVRFGQVFVASIRGPFVAEWPRLSGASGS
jgi:hypothetical protein